MTGLVAYWKMEEGSGSVLNDSSGNNHLLTVQGTPNWVNDIPPTSVSDTKSFSFDGSTYANLTNFADNTAFDFTTGFTIEAWIKSPAGGPDPGIVSKWGNSDVGFRGYMMWLTGEPSAKVEEKMDPGVPTSGNTVVSDNNWHYIAVTWDGINQKVYVDGLLDGSTSPTSTPASSGIPLLLAAYGGDSPSSRFTGEMDEVRIWDHARTESEIRIDGGVTVVPSPTPTGTQVLLNEFMPHPTDNEDWVEIVNVGSLIDISGWKLADTTGIFETFAGGTILAAGSFNTVIQSSRLNNGGDTIFLKDSSNTTIDSKSYTSGEVIIDKSIGRNPDGTGVWQACSIPSQNSTNNGIC